MSENNWEGLGRSGKGKILMTMMVVMIAYVKLQG